MKKSKEAFGIFRFRSWRGTKAGRTRRRNRYIYENQPKRPLRIVVMVKGKKPPDFPSFYPSSVL